MIVCNPNNPTGTHIPADQIGAFLEEVPRHAIVILDEAYVDFQTNDDPEASLDLRKTFPNLVCLRTFSKNFGLAGLRVGYSIGPTQFRQAVDAVRQPFSVNALAQAAAIEALKPLRRSRRPHREDDRRAGHRPGGRPRARAPHAREPGQLLLGRARRTATSRS